MSSHVLKVSVMCALSNTLTAPCQASTRRQFASQAVAKTERERVKAEPLKVSTLSNGLTVASLENHSPVTTLGVVIKVRASVK